ncbi:phosphatase PAP2 family protein [Clostridium amazonitimonense]|uniref:phosphatase PAP2 family protein n=1 Tax=Clostridium amazonitimonense TaxID=1499689 RepID=UPI0005AAC03F|nr:phosphatase PAP2 family protein [Clostridium amazonitimonense]
MNSYVFYAINNLANHNKVLDKIMIGFSKYGPYVSMAFLLAIFVIGIYKKKRFPVQCATETLIITVLSMILSFILGKVFYVDRPFVNNKVNLLIDHKSNASFPSNHAMGTMSIAVGLFSYDNLIGIFLTALSIMVGIARIYVGNHYPLDVIGGYILVFIINFVYRRYLRKFIISD